MILAAALLVACGEAVATLRPEPAEVGVGEPVLWILEVDHPASAHVRLPEGDPLPDDSWVLLEPRRVVRESRGGDRATTRATWRVLSLEAGDRGLPEVEVSVEEDGEARRLPVEVARLSVKPALAPGEDAPRPIRGFRPAPEAGGSPVILAMLAIALAAAGVLGCLWIRRRAHRRPSPAAPPTALEQLSLLERLAAEDPAASRRVVYSLCRLLRVSADRFVRADRAALVDAEWASGLESDDRVPAAARSAIARILRDAERVKYALHAPTRFALEEMLAGARRALEAIASAPPPTTAEPMPDAKPMEAAA